MEYRLLGRTGLNVSLVGFGAWGIGGPCLIKRRNAGSDFISEAKALGAVLFALEKGINLVDSSPTYGNAENIIAKALSGRRDKVIVASRIGLNGKGELKFNKKNVSDAIHSSLRNLKTGHIDILQIVTPRTYYIEPGDIIALLKPFVMKGKIRYIGVSAHNLAQAESLVESEDIDTFQIFYNLFDTRAKSFLKKAHRENKGIIVKSPLNKGVLAARYNKRTWFSEKDLRKSYLNERVLGRRLEWINQFRKELKIKKEELLPYAVNYLRSKKDIGSMLFSFKKRRHISRIISICNGGLLNKGLIDKIEEFSSNHIGILDNYFKA